VSKHPKVDSETKEVALKAYREYLKKNLPLLDPELTPEQVEDAVRSKYGVVLDGGVLEGDGKPGDREAKIKMHVKTVSSAAKAISNPPSEDFYQATQDVLLPYLDSLHGSSIDASDHSIFTKLTRKYEERFFRDVRDLNVLDPDTLTRVTEYGEYIAEFVDKIVKNKFAYQTSDGSIYFDIQAFEKDSNHYARLEPWNRNDKSLQADGEGALSQKTTEKRSDADFALWKASKPGEPAWPSVWGNGRPGWHIECSAMASDTLGETLDIHSGGIDLAFPHHDNEIAQSEAYWNEHGAEKKQWVNYFLHMGHLSIQGSKMSKSLKNFTTIREALERGDWTPRSLRVVFLLGGWKEGIEITDDLVKAGSAWEDKLNVSS
jgi:cysteinyl-tRNA synthetase